MDRKEFNDAIKLLWTDYLSDKEKWESDPSHWTNNKRKAHGLPVSREESNLCRDTIWIPYYSPSYVQLFWLAEEAISEAISEVISKEIQKLSYHTFVGDRVVTKRELCDQDWKTQLSKRYPNIPKGEEVTFLRKYNNLYGTFCDVFWNGNVYSVCAEDLIY